jgi:hypothetical protein
MILSVVVLVTLLFSYVVLPFYDAQTRIALDVERSQRELALSLRTLQEQQEYATRLGEIDRVLTQYEGAFLDTTDASSAAVQIEETVRAYASQHGVRVTRSNPLPERKIGENYLKISLQLNLESDLAGLVSFLHSISAHSEYLIVEEFYMATLRVKDRTRIRPRMRISGFVKLS